MNQTITASDYELEQAKKMREVLDELIAWQGSGKPSPHLALYKQLIKEHSWYRGDVSNYNEGLSKTEAVVRYGWQEILNGLVRGYTQRQLWAMSEAAIEHVFPSLFVAAALKSNPDYTTEEALACAALLRMSKSAGFGSIDISNL